MLKLDRRRRYQHTLLESPGRRTGVRAECVLCGSFGKKTSAHFTHDCVYNKVYKHHAEACL